MGGTCQAPQVAVSMFQYHYMILPLHSLSLHHINLASQTPLLPIIVYSVIESTSEGLLEFPSAEDLTATLA